MKGWRCYLFEGERLVFEHHGWGIIIDDRSNSRPRSLGHAYATHQACTKPFTDFDDRIEDGYHFYGEYCWSPTHESYTCGLCEQPVPEEIQALIVLQTWGR